MTGTGRARTRQPACAPLWPYGPDHCGAIPPQTPAVKTAAAWYCIVIGVVMAAWWA